MTGQPENDEPLGEGISSIFHSKKKRGVLSWSAVVMIATFPFLLLDMALNDALSKAMDIAITLILTFGIIGCCWAFFLMEGPGVLKLTLIGISVSRMWFERSTPWSNVKKVSWYKRNRTLEIEFIKSPFPWYEVYRWKNMLSVLSRDCIFLDDEHWNREDIKAMAKIITQRINQEKIEDLPPEY